MFSCPRITHQGSSCLDSNHSDARARCLSILDGFILAILILYELHEDATRLSYHLRLAFNFQVRASFRRLLDEPVEFLLAAECMSRLPPACLFPSRWRFTYIHAVARMVAVCNDVKWMAMLREFSCSITVTFWGACIWFLQHEKHPNPCHWPSYHWFSIVEESNSPLMLLFAVRGCLNLLCWICLSLL